MRKMLSKVFLAVVLAIFVSTVAMNETNASSQKVVKIVAATYGNFTITNAEGKYIKYNYNSGSYSGTMKVIKDAFGGTGPVYMAFDVEASASFTYRSNAKNSDFTILGNGYSSVVMATNARSITISNKNSVTETSITGGNMSYEIGFMAHNNGKVGANLIGKIANGTVKMSDTKQGLVITGEGGLTKIVRDDLKDRKSSIKTIYFIPYASPVIIKNINKKYSKIINAKKVYKTTYKNKINLKAYQQGKAVRLSWNPIKKAKSYVIYKYNPKTKKYYKKKTVMGQYTTLWIDRNLASNKGYRYQVRPYYGKGKYGKKSYYVSAITQSTTRGNVSKISPNKKNVKGHVGTRLRMKAKVGTSANKKTYSKNIRWFSNNHKVASITRQGKLVLKKKGKTYIWAKAHNGRNIRVNVVVR